MRPLNELSDRGIKILEQVSLSEYTTFQLGGPCPLLFHCQTPQQLEAVVLGLSERNLNYILIGSGSNLVVSDEGLSCAVVRYVSSAPIIRRDGDDLIVSGSTLLDDLVKNAIDQSLEGINYASGIPGTVGGAIVGNAGAFGKQVGDTLQSLSVLTRQGTKKEVGHDYLQFKYRNSRLKETQDIVLEARFGFKPGDQAALLNERAEILTVRHAKHPDLSKEPCAGSFFRNIEPTSQVERRQAAGYFLEEAGGKSLRVGGAKIFDKHANIIVKGPDCTAQNVHDLSVEMVKIVKEKFGIKLAREVRFVGKFNNMPAGVADLVW